MTFDSITPPIAQPFTCDRCKSVNQFWSVTPDKVHREPNREIKDDQEKLDTTVECPHCNKINTIYWYTPKSF